MLMKLIVALEVGWGLAASARKGWYSGSKGLIPCQAIINMRGDAVDKEKDMIAMLKKNNAPMRIKVISSQYQLRSSPFVFIRACLIGGSGVGFFGVAVFVKLADDFYFYVNRIAEWIAIGVKSLPFGLIHAGIRRRGEHNPKVCVVSG